jgi:Ala-tRNA(Pro) deacylase
MLNKLKIEYRWIDHPPVFTIADLNNLPEDANPIKNLLIQEENGERKFLIVMAGNARMNQKLIREKLNTKKLRFATDETLRLTFGVASGAVSIFGLLHGGAGGVEVVIDEEILNTGKELGFHPNDNTATIFFAPENLKSIINSMAFEYTVMKLY